MKVELVVREPFGKHGKGDAITDQSEVAAVLDSHPTHVVKVAAKEPAPTVALPK